MKVRVCFLLGWMTLVVEAEKRPSMGVEALPEDLAKPTARALTDEELAKRQRQGAGKPSPVPMKPQGFGYLEMSVLLADREGYVVLPKGCLVVAPNGLEVRVVEKPVGVMLTWTEFLQKNRRWLATEEVGMAQVKGDEKLPVKALEGARKDGRALVAVYRGLPITVLPPREVAGVDTQRMSTP